MKNKHDDIWFEEHLSDNEKRSYRLKNVLCHEKSKFHEIHIYDLFDNGISLILDGHARVFEIDEFIYHEGFVHSSISRMDKIKSILVLGDGDGGLIRELLKCPEIKNIDWVEIDQAVVECCEQHLPSFPVGYKSDERVTLHFEDGVEFLRRTKNTYDIAFVSVTVSPETQFTTPFQNPDIYRQIRRVINNGGLVAHSLDEFSPASIGQYFLRVQVVQSEFKFVAPFSIPLPSFGSNWGFVLASASPIREPKDCSPPGLRFYNLEEDDRMFRIPSYLVSDIPA